MRRHRRFANPRGALESLRPRDLLD
jgi:hypothetical protein